MRQAIGALSGGRREMPMGQGNFGVHRGTPRGVDTKDAFRGEILLKIVSMIIRFFLQECS
jgi:hypothetical protein